MAEQKIQINGIDEVKTQTILRKIMDKGEEVDRKLVTKVTFEGELDPAEIAQIHRLLKAGHSINVDIYSPQLSMKLDTVTP